MQSDDMVDPGDAAVQALLPLTAENTHDEGKRDMLIDGILSLPSLRVWPPEWREILLEACHFIKGLGEDLRRRGEIRDGGGDRDLGSDRHGV